VLETEEEGFMRKSPCIPDLLQGIIRALGAFNKVVPTYRKVGNGTGGAGAWVLPPN
jgi:hypothetical protein